MVFFGHLGIGRTLVRPWSRRFAVGWILLGTILPDLLDKTAHYILGISDSTRTLGHTGIFLFVLAGVGGIVRSRLIGALCLGIATHLALDSLTELVVHGANAEIAVTLMWPVKGWSFPALHEYGLSERIQKIFHPFLVGSEILGLSLLGWEYRTLLRKTFKIK